MNTIATIIEGAAEAFGVSAEEIRGPRKFHMLARARQAVYLVAREAGRSSEAIGRALQKDHSSVVAGAQRARELEQADTDYALKVQAVRDYVAPPRFIRNAEFVSKRSGNRPQESYQMARIRELRDLMCADRISTKEGLWNLLRVFGGELSTLALVEVSGGCYNTTTETLRNLRKEGRAVRRGEVIDGKERLLWRAVVPEPAS